MTSVYHATREQVLAFRLEGHHLVARKPIGELSVVAGSCGIRNTPPGSSLLALHARVSDLTTTDVDRALADEKTLVEALGMRISPHLVPASDLMTFTLGALPAEEASLRGVLNTFTRQLDEAGIRATDALEMATQAALTELEDGPLSRGALSAGMTRQLPEALSRYCRACSSTHVFESLFRLVGVQGAWVITRVGKQNTYVRTDQWLGAMPGGDRQVLRADLLLRYLRCFGPSTARDFADWVGVSGSEAEHDWDRIADDLVEVDIDGRPAWLHGDDLATLKRESEPTGVRFLPPYDAYLDQRDRTTLLPDAARHRQVWTVLGNPGAVLVDGEMVGIWRPKKRGKRFEVTVTAFGSLAPDACVEIEAEATQLGPLRDCTTVEVTFDA